MVSASVRGAGERVDPRSDLPNAVFDARRFAVSASGIRGTLCFGRPSRRAEGHSVVHPDRSGSAVAVDLDEPETAAWGTAKKNVGDSTVRRPGGISTVGVDRLSYGWACRRMVRPVQNGVAGMGSIPFAAIVLGRLVCPLRSLVIQLVGAGLHLVLCASEVGNHEATMSLAAAGFSPESRKSIMENLSGIRIGLRQPSAVGNKGRASVVRHESQSSLATKPPK